MLTSKEVGTKIITSEKTTMKKYPIWSRPVLTKKALMELNAITGRLGSRV
jgi:hypothetical protein